MTLAFVTGYYVRAPGAYGPGKRSDTTTLDQTTPARP